MSTDFTATTTTITTRTYEVDSYAGETFKVQVRFRITKDTVKQEYKVQVIGVRSSFGFGAINYKIAFDAWAHTDYTERRVPESSYMNVSHVSSLQGCKTWVPLIDYSEKPEGESVWYTSANISGLSKCVWTFKPFETGQAPWIKVRLTVTHGNVVLNGKINTGSPTHRIEASFTKSWLDTHLGMMYVSPEFDSVVVTPSWVDSKNVRIGFSSKTQLPCRFFEAQLHVKHAGEQASKLVYTGYYLYPSDKKTVAGTFPALELSSETLCVVKLIGFTQYGHGGDNNNWLEGVHTAYGEATFRTLTNMSCTHTDLDSELKTTVSVTWDPDPDGPAQTAMLVYRQDGDVEYTLDDPTYVFDAAKNVKGVTFTFGVSTPMLDTYYEARVYPDDNLYAGVADPRTVSFSNTIPGTELGVTDVEAELDYNVDNQRLELNVHSWYNGKFAAAATHMRAEIKETGQPDDTYLLLEPVGSYRHNPLDKKVTQNYILNISNQLLYKVGNYSLRTSFGRYDEYGNWQQMGMLAVAYKMDFPTLVWRVESHPSTGAKILHPYAVKMLTQDEKKQVKDIVNVSAKCVAEGQTPSVYQIADLGIRNEVTL